MVEKEPIAFIDDTEGIAYLWKEGKIIHYEPNRDWKRIIENGVLQRFWREQRKSEMAA